MGYGALQELYNLPVGKPKLRTLQRFERVLNVFMFSKLAHPDAGRLLSCRVRWTHLIGKERHFLAIFRAEEIGI